MTALSWIGSLPIQSWCEAMSLKEQTASEKGILSQISKLTLQQNSVNTQLSVYSQLNSMLQSFQTSVTQLTNSFSATFQVASSNSNIATAQISNSSSIASGSHALNVTKLAQGSSTASQEYLSKTAALNMTNSLTMTVGTEHITVNVGATDTLDSIAANINANAKATGLGVSASVVSTGADGAGVTRPPDSANYNADR